MESGTQFQTLNDALWVLLRLETHLFSLPLLANCRGSLASIRQPVKEKDNTEFKSALLHLKLTLCHILSVAEGLGKCKYHKLQQQQQQLQNKQQQPTEIFNFNKFEKEVWFGSVWFV